MNFLILWINSRLQLIKNHKLEVYKLFIDKAWEKGQRVVGVSI